MLLVILSIEIKTCKALCMPFIFYEIKPYLKFKTEYDYRAIILPHNLFLEIQLTGKKLK